MASLTYAIGRLYPQAVDYQELALEALRRLAKEGEWFAPTNATGSNNDYSICDELHHAGIIARKRLPLWNQNGIFTGYRVEFMYREDLQYRAEK